MEGAMFVLLREVFALVSLGAFSLTALTWMDVIGSMPV
jgi:hypothetical protein